jgi:hypothetical protein
MFMMRGVTYNSKVSSWILGISKVPIKFYITLKALIHQKTVKEVAKVIVVGFFLKESKWECSKSIQSSGGSSWNRRSAVMSCLLLRMSCPLMPEICHSKKPQRK